MVCWKGTKCLPITHIPPVMRREIPQTVNQSPCFSDQEGRCRATGGTASSPRVPCGWWGWLCMTKASTSATPSAPSGYGPSRYSCRWPLEVSWWGWEEQGLARGVVVMVYNTVTGEGTAPVPLRWEFSLAWEQTSGPESSISWWESLKGSRVPRLVN